MTRRSMQTVRSTYPPALVKAISLLAEQYGRSRVSAALGFPRATVYRWASEMSVKKTSVKKTTEESCIRQIRRLCCQLDAEWDGIKRSIERLVGKPLKVSAAARPKHLLPDITSRVHAIPESSNWAKVEQYIKIKTYLDQHYFLPIFTDDIAKQFQLNPFSLIRAFKRYFGLPPYQYLLQLRVQKARVALSTRGVDLKMVAQRVGFGSVDSMSRAFKKYVGYTAGTIPMS